MKRLLITGTDRWTDGTREEQKEKIKESALHFDRYITDMHKNIHVLDLFAFQSLSLVTVFCMLSVFPASVL